MLSENDVVVGIRSYFRVIAALKRRKVNYVLCLETVVCGITRQTKCAVCK